MIMNKQYDKTSYEQQVKKILEQYSHQQLRAKMQELCRGHAVRAALSLVNAQDSVGNYLVNTNNAVFSFDATDTEDCRYCDDGSSGQKDNRDCSGTAGQLCYDSLVSWQCYRSAFTNWSV